MTAAGSDDRALRFAESLEEAAKKGGVVWSQLSCEQMAREFRRLARVAGELERLEQEWPIQWPSGSTEVAFCTVEHRCLELRQADSELARLRDGLRQIQAVAVMTQNEHARTHRLDWLREIEDRARALLSGGQAESTKEQG